MNTKPMLITPKAIQDLLDELEASRASRKRAWEVLQEIRCVLKETAGIEVSPLGSPALRRQLRSDALRMRACRLPRGRSSQHRRVQPDWDDAKDRVASLVLFLKDAWSGVQA